MMLAPTITQRLNRARGDMRMGLPVVLADQGAAALVVAVEALDQAGLAALRALGQPELALTERRATTLKARAYDGDLARIVVPGDVDVAWVRALADPSDDLRHPMKGPLRSVRDGTVSLHRAAVALAKSAHLLPAAVVVPVMGGMALASAHDLTFIALAEAGPALEMPSPLHEVTSARLPMVASEAGRVHIFRPEDGTEEHYAIEIGQPDRCVPVLARLHSACFTGDVLGSLNAIAGRNCAAPLARWVPKGLGCCYT